MKKLNFIDTFHDDQLPKPISNIINIRCSYLFYVISNLGNKKMEKI